MKYLNILFLFLLINLSFFSCVEHDKNSNKKVNATAGVFTRKQVELGSLLYTNNGGAHVMEKICGAQKVAMH